MIITISKLVALPIASSLIITKISVGDYDGAKQSVIMFVCFSLLIGVLTPITKYVGMLGDNKVYSELAMAYISKLVSVDIDYFNSNLAGYLTSATRQYIDNSINLARNIRDRYLPTILSVLLPIFVILWFDVFLGLLIFIMSIIQTFYILWMSHAIDPYRRKTREIYRKNSGLMSDIVSNILVVKSTAQENNYINQVGSGMDVEVKLHTARHFKQIKMIVFREIITVVFFLVLLWLTVYRLEGGFINVVGAALVVAYTLTILTGIYNLSDNLDEHDDFVDKIIPAFDILNRKNTIEDPDYPKEFNDVSGDIEFKNISFIYDSEKGGKPLLVYFSLKISHGEKIGVVGLSGAGKSTLIKLLLRFNKLHQGEILIDGISICDILQKDLRSKISYVPQEPLLFHTSIKENVLVSKPDASDSEIIHALSAAHADKFISQLPDGIDSVVGERGVKLSGGQKQRIAIARAVLQHAPIMVLDEATSALDSESEQIIKNSFKDVLKGKTAIVIAHRLSTLSDMDRIIVIDEGKLVEDGTHRELLLNKGLYARLWHRQQKNIET